MCLKKALRTVTETGTQGPLGPRFLSVLNCINWRKGKNHSLFQFYSFVSNSRNAFSWHYHNILVFAPRGTTKYCCQFSFTVLRAFFKHWKSLNNFCCAMLLVFALDPTPEQSCLSLQLCVRRALVHTRLGDTTALECLDPSYIYIREWPAVRMRTKV